jgi:hypothetical protein
MRGMSVQLPTRFTQAWIERTLPGLSPADTDFVLAALRAKGWSEKELDERVYPHARQRRVAAAKPPRRRRPRVRKPTLTELSAFTGIVGALAAVMALFGPFGASRDEPTPPGPAGSGRVPAVNAEAQAKLLLHIPAAVRRTCDPDEDLRKRFRATATVRCALPGASQVAYYSFANAAALTAAYAPTPNRLPYGSCGPKWNVESGYHTEKSKTDVGLLTCYNVDGRAWIKWTRDDLMLYAYASRDDTNRARLFKAWNAAGPIG